jgi:hypothetical protein
MLVIFDFNQSKNNSIYSYGIINIIWYKTSEKQLTELWLVLLMGSLSSVSYELNESENYQMESKFDRVYLMADFDAKILRVK